jgi:transposase InsO family protein
MSENIVVVDGDVRPEICPEQGPQAPLARPHSSFDFEYRKKVIERALQIGVAKACRELGVAKACTVHRWMSRYKAEGWEGLQPKSRRPHHQPKQTSSWIVEKILGLKKEKPEMGSRAVSEHLGRFEAVSLSSRTIGKLFKKHSLPDGDAGYYEASHRTKGDQGHRLERTMEAELGEWERFSRPNPNDLWQMDIMGFYIRGEHKVYLISALDDCSRMIVGWGLFRDQSADNVLEVLRGGLVRHGAPREILTDQGAQFKHWNGVTQFEKLLKKLNIDHIKARSHHPQTCGKIEAFHKSIHRELIDKEFFISEVQAVEKIARFIEHYNYGRPHSSLDGFAPSDRYFGVIDSVKKYLADIQPSKNPAEEHNPALGVARKSLLYLVGRCLGHDVRIQEAGGQLSIHVDNHPFKEISLVAGLQN